MVCIVQSHAQFRYSHYDASSLINTNTVVNCLSTTPKGDVRFFLQVLTLSLLQKGSQEAVLQGQHSSTARVPRWQRRFPPSPLCSQNTSVWSETFSFLALIYLLPVYSLCLKTSATLNPPGIYSLNQLINNDPFWIFVFPASSIYLSSPAALLCIQNNLLLFLFSILTRPAMRLALHSNILITPGDDTVLA